MSTQVIVAPPTLGSGYVPGYLIVRPTPYGIACRDGSFADNIDLKRVIFFGTAMEAVEWAEAKPRSWVVVNKGMF